MISEFLWSILSSPKVVIPTHPQIHDNCHYQQALADGLRHAEVQKLASLGSNGLQPSHCSRDLVRMLGPAFQQLPRMESVAIPVEDSRSGEQKQIMLDIQYPHDVFAHYAGSPMEFHKLFGTEEELQKFWESKDLRDPGFRSHPALARDGFQQLCVPLKVHSDGVKLSKHESLHVISWTSFFSQGDVMQTQWLFAALVKSAWTSGPAGDTTEELYKHLVWSFQACLAGTHPVLDWDGEPFPPNSYRAQVANKPLHPKNYFMAVFMVCGDLEELCNSYGLRHFNATESCFWCSCNDTDKPWTDFSPAAVWRGTVVSEEEALQPSAHPLWKTPGLTVWNVAWDILHGLDLGPTIHVIGNILDDLVQLRQLGRNQEDRVKELWTRAKRHYQDLQIQNRLPGLDLGSFKNQADYPKMRCKANEARHFLPVLKQLLAVDPVESTYNFTRARLLDSLISFYTVVDSKKLVLSQQEARQGKRHVLMFLRDYATLSKQAMDQGLLKWQLTIKFHYLAHAAELLVWANPKFSSTYTGESFVGKVAKVAASASIGKPPVALGGLLMSKIQAGRAVRLRQHLQ